MAFLILTFFVIFLTFIILQKYLMLRRYFWKKKHGFISVGFFHPYCNDGGGGERVLWSAILAVQKKYSIAQCVVYTGDAAPSEEILEKVYRNLNIELLRPIKFVRLKCRFLVESKYYPYFTLLMQSLGSVVLGIEAAFKHAPHIYIDTMGYSWTLPIFKYLVASKIGAYVHYPTISTDMLTTVLERRISVNNKEFISSSSIFSFIKLIYYRIFAFLYGLMGRQAQIIMVNSSWTKDHILKLWKKPNHTFVVYPPCDVSQFQNIPLLRDNNKELRILSIAQFRPEKDHELQIKSFHQFLIRSKCIDSSDTLVLIGSCRHAEDFARVEKLKVLSSKLGIAEKIEFKINLSFQEIMQEMEKADVALHTMWNEHFGIGVVECMSAGLIMIAHNSGGPKLDIIRNQSPDQTGFLADSVETYASALETVKDMSSEQLLQIRKNARQSVSRFSVPKFENSFLDAVKTLFS
ncbi:GDP-Man:Man(3)GlcNAc(2)-PP-Dol alpha-1,2-mannosyltransferase-like [Uloborus diversus]|uniref:GDP-Man:Man(3)GlcNAc(2)-PP-Dol alpha-1,2-mannosyltransferase-like n=1 Tax=Uloborus diversus TaxID=327109 RepID=UPI00240987AB|nr:GDP-Man:Man(3)GlcNAc(2)-PP-Dol alpha-1,2-mannosyltransferase-like [Uloborus diversus]